MDISLWAETFSELGRRLEKFGGEPRSCAMIAAATAENRWFTENDIRMAVGAVRERLLDGAELKRWLSSYEELNVREKPSPGEGKKLAVVMAGNIPLAGFFDLMCGLACGFGCRVKSSRKDGATIDYIIKLLREIHPGVDIGTGLPAAPDAILAMGSDNTVRALRAAYPGVPALLRGSRYSIAVLSGRESDDDVMRLAVDIFSYSGLGCRNVSLLMLPSGDDPARIAALLSRYGPVNPAYRNNYLQNKALATMNGQEFLDGGFFTMLRSEEFPSFVSRISYCFYDDVKQIDRWVEERDARLQCIVSGFYRHPSAAGFGESQFPRLTDYPDRKDTVRFLCDAVRSPQKTLNL